MATTIFSGKGGGGHRLGGNGGHKHFNHTHGNRTHWHESRGGAVARVGKALKAALIFHGKFGSIDRGQGFTRAVENGVPTLDVAALSFAGTWRHLIHANPEYTVDIFGHSWTPAMGPAVDAMYRPKRSAHQMEELSRNRNLCNQIATKLRQLTAAVGIAAFQRFGVVGRGTDSCLRTASHLLGMQRAIELKAKYESQMRFKYDLVIVSRWDVLWARPLYFAKLDVAGHSFSLPTYCTNVHGRADARVEPEKSHVEWRHAVCGGWAGQPQVPTAAANCHPLHRPCSGDLSPRARELYLLDWWFASSSEAADVFGLVADEAIFANYTLINSQKLNSERSPRPMIMGHAYWGMHMIWGLRAKLRFVAAISVDFSLSRVWKRDTGSNTCRGLKAVCLQPPCGVSDVVRRPWQTIAARTPPEPKPKPKYRYGAAETLAACGEGYFTCHGKSRMCEEEQLTWEPMDTTLARHAWYNCTQVLCASLHVQPYAPQCAGAILMTYAMIWKHWPNASNTSLSMEFREAGVFDGAAVGWHDPTHAASALSSLTRHAAELLQRPLPRGGGTLHVSKVLQGCPAVPQHPRRVAAAGANRSSL